MTRTEYFRGGQEGRRVQVYVELRDMWIGVFWPSNAFYLVVFGVVIRIERGRK